MSFDQHRGAVAPGPFSTSPDPRVSEHGGHLSVLAAIVPGLAAAGMLADPFRVVQPAARTVDENGLLLGLVVHALPYLGWYKVQAGNLRGFVAACMLSHTGFVPLGVRDTSVVPPNSQVLLYKPRGLNYAFILGVVPPILQDGTIVNPDWLCQGGGAGFRCEAAHSYPIRGLYKAGGVIDFSGQRPVDGTAFEWGKMAATGVGLMVSDFEAWVRVNEQCGLFLNTWDSHARLAGVQLDVVSAVHETLARDDEGEARFAHQVATYPWEALGLYAPGTPFTETYRDHDVQYGGTHAKVDLPHDAGDVQPVYRWQEYGGYLGQGHVRCLMRPASDSGLRRHGDADRPDEGLFHESVAIDGAYMLRSAKSVHIGRRCLIVVPRERRVPEDGAEGDDAAAGNYRFSGRFGGAEDAPPHRLAEVAIDGDWQHLRRVAGIEDLIAHGANWRALHPFHYHEGDYHTPQEGAQAAHFSAVQERVDFTPLARDPFLPDPEPVVLAIDHRYTDAKYYQRESFLTFLDDGGVVLGCGYGAQLVFSGGHIRAEAPGDVVLAPGRDVIAFGDQVVIRARRSVDVSASAHDVRIKAERNMQLLAGNAGAGGVLIESRSRSDEQAFRDAIGEDVVSNGVVIRAPRSTVAALAGAIYLRTGGADMDGGDILLDAGKGNGRVQAYGASFNAYCAAGVNFFFGPVAETSTVQHVCSFSPTQCVLDAPVAVGGPVILYGGGLIVDGTVLATGDVATSGQMADASGMFLGQVPGTFRDSITAVTGTLATAATRFGQAGTRLHDATVVARWYADLRLGNDAVVPGLQFSYRDAADHSQYGTERFAWVERRWEQMVRFGQGVGGNPWFETAVAYQGADTYPYPGRDKWLKDPTFLRLKAHTMFAAGGYSADRPGPYEAPRLDDWDAVTMETAYRLVRPGDN